MFLCFLVLTIVYIFTLFYAISVVCLTGSSRSFGIIGLVVALILMLVLFFGKVINEFVDKEVTSEEAKKILKSRIECKSEIMYDRIENKKLIKGAPEDYNWVDYKLSFDKLTLSRVSKSKVSKLKNLTHVH